MNNTVDYIDINTFSSVGEYVYAEIRRQIINWQLKPGQRISEAEMSKILNVSRTPVREGFIRLKNEGLVEILSQRGTIISKIDLKKVEESVFIRKCLEKEVIKCLCGNLKEEDEAKCRRYIRKQEESLNDKDYIKFHKYDVEFHKVFFTALNKEYTWDFIEYTNAQYERVRMLTLLDFDKFKQLYDAHIELLDLIINDNFQKASGLIDEHLDKIMDEIEVLKKEHKGDFIN